MRLITLSIALLFTICSFAQEPEGKGYIVEVGELAPDFTLTLTSGDTIRLSSLRGKVVMLQFTASWCGVCRKEMPYIESEIWQKYKEHPEFALFGIDREEPLETVENFIKRVGITYPIGLDPTGSIFTRYADKNAGITRNIIIDRSGKIVMLTRLFNLEEFAEMCHKIEELLNH